VPGLLVEALRRRRASGLAPFTVLSCDNMPDNGTRTKRALSMLAAHNAGELAAWIDSAVACPSSMVDRIVPAATAESTKKLEALLGFSDPAAVACESFSQWVIEDRFVSGRPDWEPDGVEMVASVKPFETMKLRLLNGAHSLLTYVGLSRGKTTVAEAIGDPGLQSLVGRFFREAAASLDAAVRRDIDRYTSALINLEHGRTIDATATALAAWMLYVRGSNDRGRTWQVDDPLAAKLAQCHDRPKADEIVDSLLAMQEIFSARLRRRDDFRNAVRRAYSEALR
jgi:fructuronate reductase